MLKSLSSSQDLAARHSPAFLDALTAKLFARVDEKLIPPRHVYAILDCARDPKIFRMVKESPKAALCLYRGEIEQPLREAAPHLVELVGADEWTRDLLIEGWGRSWGVFLEAAVPEVALVRHLRSFLKVTDEKKRKLVFRYYDPRVLRVYLPTTTPEEGRMFTGPLGRYVMESDDGQAIVSFERSPDGLVRRETPVLVES